MQRKRPLQLQPRRSKPTDKHKVSTGGEVPENKPAGVVALMAQTQQIPVQAQRLIELPRYT